MFLLNFIILFLFNNIISAKLNYNAKATLWQSTSAEYRALCYQTYNMAKHRIGILAKKKCTKKRAIILDVDETVLSHSLFDSYLVKNGLSFTEELWEKWLASLKASAISGALDFTKYAKQHGFELFYITNMRAELAKYGVKRMKQLGFPNAELKYYFARTKTKDKNTRRNLVKKLGYKIVMYIGDQLTDMPGFSRSKDINKRYEELELNKNKFGISYFLLPNVIYGAWTRPLNRKFTEEQIKKTWRP